MNRSDFRVLRVSLASIWIVTSLLSFGLYPIEESLLLVQGLPLPREGLLFLVYAGALSDLVMGVLTLAWPRRVLWQAQMALILVYTVLATLLVPAYWLHPFGPLLKNVAIIALLWLLYRYDQGNEQ